MAEPKIRFKRADGSGYPAWTAGKLGDITEKVDRKAPKGSTAPVMMVSQGNGFIYQADKYSRENAGQSLKNYTLLKQGEFAYNHGASKAKPYGVAYCLTEEPEARVPFVYHTFRITDGVNSYWHEALNTTKMDRQLKRMVSSGARMDGLLNINYDTYMDVDVNIPCLEEQQKIAYFLSSVDEVITASEQEVANLETQKKAVMKKIFSQEVRFKRADGSEFPEWEENVVGDYLSDITYGFTNPMPDADEGPWKITAKDIVDGKICYETARHTTEDAYYNDLTDKSRPILNDILLTKDGTLGRVAIVRDDVEICINQSVALLRLKDNSNVDPLFFMTMLMSPVYQERMIADAGGGTIKHIYITKVDKMMCAIPCPEEQRLIADFLSSFDEAIAAAKKELELWKRLKKGLLQQMFV